MRNVSGDGVWSSRGTAIPVGGAIGGGDDYYYKIGRNRRPYYQGDMGSPTQSADANFSSLLGQNAGGYDPEEFDRTMFPDQDQVSCSQHYNEEYDDTHVDDVTPLRTRKLSKPKSYLRIRENNLPSMIEIYDTDPGDIDFLNEISIETAIRGVVGGVTSVLDLIPNPAVQTFVSIISTILLFFDGQDFMSENNEAGAALKMHTGVSLAEAGQLDEDGFKELIGKICELDFDARADLRKEIDDVTDTLRPVVSEIIAMWPGAGKMSLTVKLTPDSVVNLFGEILSKLTTITGVERILNNFIGPSYVGLFVKRIGSLPFRGIAATAMVSRYGIILNATHADDNPCSMYAKKPDRDDIEKKEKGLEAADIDSEEVKHVLSNIGREIDTGNITAGDVFMAVSTKDPSYLGLSEIRTFIRESISEIEKSDDDEIDEFSVVGGISGAITPLGTDSSGRRDSRDSHVKRAKTSAKFFGGGSLADPDSPKRDYTAAEKFAKGVVRKPKKNQAK